MRLRGRSDRAHLAATADWLARAQEVNGDGGVAGRYHLRRGWSSSYPETTGYAIPTLLRLAKELDAGFLRRAEQAVEFLLRIQLPGGAFPGLEIGINRTEPSPFNTAQIIHGLAQWHRASGERRVLKAALRAGEWLVSVQDDDGAWRRYFYEGEAATYSAYATGWLAELGEYAGRGDFLAACERHMDWVMQHYEERTGWFDRCGFTSADHRGRRAVTHTIAYTLAGVFKTCELLGRDDGVAAVRQAARGIAVTLEQRGWLPGVLDWQWQPRADYACLTGNAQLALLWWHLYRRFGEGVFREAALRALALVKAAQPLGNPNPGIRGGIAGSDPIWGGYISFAFPNWAAKFFVDALLTERDLEHRP